jgi:hypothetical protein
MAENVSYKEHMRNTYGFFSEKFSGKYYLED